MGCHCSPSSSLLPSPQKPKPVLPSSSKSISQNPKPKSRFQSEQKSKPKNHSFFLRFSGFLRWILGCVAMIFGFLRCCWCFPALLLVSSCLAFSGFLPSVVFIFFNLLEIESVKVDLLQ